MPLNFAGIQVPKEIQPSIKSPQSPKLLGFFMIYYYNMQPMIFITKIVSASFLQNTYKYLNINTIFHPISASSALLHIKTLIISLMCRR